MPATGTMQRQSSLANECVSSSDQFQGSSDPLPRTLRAGLAYSWFGDALNGMVDEVVPFAVKLPGLDVTT